MTCKECDCRLGVIISIRDPILIMRCNRDSICLVLRGLMHRHFQREAARFLACILSESRLITEPLGASYEERHRRLTAQ